MTPLQLLDALEAFVKQETKDILLPVRVDRKSGENKERAAEVYKMRLPNKTAQTERVPYLLLQYIKAPTRRNRDRTRKANAPCVSSPPPIRRTKARAQCAS